MLCGQDYTKRYSDQPSRTNSSTSDSHTATTSRLFFLPPPTHPTQVGDACSGSSRWQLPISSSSRKKAIPNKSSVFSMTTAPYHFPFKASQNHQTYSFRIKSNVSGTTPARLAFWSNTLSKRSTPHTEWLCATMAAVSSWTNFPETESIW